jgi:hypothetical protein
MQQANGTPLSDLGSRIGEEVTGAVLPPEGVI